MESNMRRRRDNPKVEPKPTVASPAVGATPAVHGVPYHVLELILLHLDSVCLVRAASACKRWCRVVADAGFQRRLCLVLVLGHYVCGPGDPVFVPSPTGPSIYNYNRQSLSLDFVPKTDGYWKIADCRGGLVLLRKRRGATWCRRLNPDLVVCEPLIRRYRAISVLPDMLAGRSELGLFLLEGGGLSGFKVMAVVLKEHRNVPGRGVPGACVYSGRDGTWHDLPRVSDGIIDVPARTASFFFAGRANGSLYWGLAGGTDAAALVLDEATAGFSQVALPESIQGWHGHEGRCFRVIGGEDGTMRAVCLIDNELRVYARLHGGDEWVMIQNVVRLPEDTHGLQECAWIVAATEMYVLVTPRHSKWLFSVDLKTMAVERVRNRNVYKEGNAYPYELPWPPVLKA